ncbi:DUF1016 family protein [Vibrio vulnificus]|nr:DUF1016 family protein [Vibrio vulnificus]
MKDKFAHFLEQRKVGLKSNEYFDAINLVSEHYSQQARVPVDIFSINKKSFERISKFYVERGKFSEFVEEQELPVREALSLYKNMLTFSENSILMQAVEDFCADSKLDRDEIGLYREKVAEYTKQQHQVVTPTPNLEVMFNDLSSNFAYEKDLQRVLCKQVFNLFPDYQIYGGIAVGVEFQVATRRIDVLLEHKVDNSLLVIELKSGKADFKVFGQLSMYMALVQREFPNRVIKGVIIAGEIEDSLSQAAETNEKVKLMTYEMSIQLQEA